MGFYSEFKGLNVSYNSPFNLLNKDTEQEMDKNTDMELWLNIIYRIRRQYTENTLF